MQCNKTPTLNHRTEHWYITQGGDHFENFRETLTWRMQWRYPSLCLSSFSPYFCYWAVEKSYENVGICTAVSLCRLEIERKRYSQVKVPIADVWCLKYKGRVNVMYPSSFDSFVNCALECRFPLAIVASHFCHRNAVQNAERRIRNKEIFNVFVFAEFENHFS
jgi:hypothetical protein